MLYYNVVLLESFHFSKSWLVWLSSTLFKLRVKHGSIIVCRSLPENTKVGKKAASNKWLATGPAIFLYIHMKTLKGKECTTIICLIRVNLLTSDNMHKQLNEHLEILSPGCLSLVIIEYWNSLYLFFPGEYQCCAARLFSKMIAFLQFFFTVWYHGPVNNWEYCLCQLLARRVFVSPLFISWSSYLR